jgi:hypothetical protein
VHEQHAHALPRQNNSAFCPRFSLDLSIVSAESNNLLSAFLFINSFKTAMGWLFKKVVLKIIKNRPAGLHTQNGKEEGYL